MQPQHQPTPLTDTAPKRLPFEHIALLVCLGLALFFAPAACTVGTSTCSTNSECTTTGSCQQGQCAPCTNDTQCDKGQSCKVGACMSGGGGTKDGGTPGDAGTPDLTGNKDSTTDKAPADKGNPSDQTDPDKAAPDKADPDKAGPDTPPQETQGDKSHPDVPACKAGTSRPCYGGNPKEQGVGACKAGTQTCSDQGLWSPCLGEVTPSPERCGDAIDNDCDGKIDEADAGCQCKPGEQKPCGSDEGACKKGTLFCNTKGAWGECVGEVKPSTEKCDGVDNDCDGDIDEEWKELGSTCTSGEGACKTSGKRVCRKDGAGTECNAKPGAPTLEACDGKDNDCNGQIDEALLRECYKGSASTKNVGNCKAGTQECTSGKWSACKGQVLPSTKEACDGVDDDCDGRVDEGCVCTNGKKRACGSTKGTCKAGTQTCNSGRWGTCVGEVKPVKELCDGLDNDCDGSVDENFSSKGKACSVGVGICKRSGTFVCSADKTKLVCNAKAGPSAKETCDNKDNDCDGIVDEGLKRSCYTGKAGTEGVGVCKKGSQSCSAGKWGACAGQIIPKSEKCNGVDDDCDGGVDENFSNKGKACTNGLGACKRSGTYVCKSDGSTTVCNATPGSPSTETCNKIDDNCDGKIDNGIFGSCSVGSCRGIRRCTNGQLTCDVPDPTCCRTGRICR